MTKKRRKSLFASLALLALVIANACTIPSASSTSQAQTRILVFSKTTGFRHDSIPDGIAALRRLGQQNNFTVDATEDAAAFNDANLAQYQAVVFLSTTGDLLNANQKAAFERYLRAGKGFVGVHSASDTEYNWPWYGGLVGAYFQDHPAIQRAQIKVEDRAHPATAALPAVWERVDEWYNFRSNPRGRVHVLATLDETTYSGGGMGADHPLVWCQLYDGGRAWYTAGGHTRESYSEPLYLQHLLGGVQFAAGLKDGACAVLTAASAASFQPDALASGSIAAIFGSALATATQAANIIPLPTALADTMVRVKGRTGADVFAPLFFVSPTQLNWQIPANLPTGSATFTVVKSDGTAPSGLLPLAGVAPALFAANANGRGAAAGVLLIRTDDFRDVFAPLAVFDVQSNSFVPRPIDISFPLNQYFLVLFGTGFRARSSLAAVKVQIGGVEAPVTFAGAQGELIGVDQLNVAIPRSLAGRGEVDVTLLAEGKTANAVRINIR